MTALEKPKIEEQEKYENLGGAYFPILQQDGSRVLIKIGNGRTIESILFLAYLRKHDRKIAPTEDQKRIG